ncbi:uncharacterized protein LOC127758030 [Oryza glaberrima]|uniref:uncharacterized protein LOC127758030 n=1 Tax=Oryza glaberrima TaxID=4538 RepID=UPI00224C395D|nr:uncharacterized protein LOC127758030 [Oryza glaberrima]XP_052139607.1 uncharacterized protein LOC127758030 [Oryza glaberrima]
MLVTRSRLFGVSQLRKSSLKHLLKFRSMSDQSSVLAADDTETSWAMSDQSSVPAGKATETSLGDFPKHLRKLPPWIQEPVSVHEVNDTLKHIEEKSNEFKLLSSDCMQKKIFEQEIRPFLLSRGLLCTSPMGSLFVKGLHKMNHTIHHKFPRYVTSKSLMKLLTTRSQEQWRPILEYLADERVIVLLDWINELSLLEVHFFDHGLLLAPQSGEPHDARVYKLETDACYHKPEASSDKKKDKLKKSVVPVTKLSSPENEEQTSDPLGRATVASVLWESIRARTKLIEIQIVKGLFCKDSEHAEGVGLFMAVKRPKELGIRKLDVVTDNEANYNVMIGKRDVSKSSSPETSMAFIQAAKEYDICKCRREPREMISHVNDLAKEAHTKRTNALNLREIIERKSPQFWGMPFVRIKQDDSSIKAKLGGSKVATHLLKQLIITWRSGARLRKMMLLKGYCVTLILTL